MKHVDFMSVLCGFLPRREGQVVILFRANIEMFVSTSTYILTNTLFKIYYITNDITWYDIILNHHSYHITWYII